MRPGIVPELLQGRNAGSVAFVAGDRRSGAVVGFGRASDGEVGAAQELWVIASNREPDGADDGDDGQYRCRGP